MYRKLNLFAGAFELLRKIGVEKSDDSLTINRKNFVVYEALLMSVGGILWGVLCLILGREEQAIIPLSYTALSFLNIFIFWKFKRFKFTQGFQTAISLLLPFLFQWHLGGFAASGVVMIWALLAFSASLSYTEIRTSYAWLIVYVVLVITSAFIDETVREMFPFDISNRTAVIFTAMNISFVSVFVSLLTVFYINQNAKSFQKAEEVKDLLIDSEKLVALGQLSAGIMHEINTPLGVIKSLATNNLSITENPRDNISLFMRLDSKTSEDMMKYLNQIDLHVSHISSTEKRVLISSLVKALEEVGSAKPRSAAQKLAVIGVFDLPNFLLSCDTELVDEIIDYIYSDVSLRRNNSIMRESVDRASRITSALKLYTHFDTKDEIEYWSLKRSLETVLTLYQNELKKGIDVELDVDESIDVFFNIDELNQVWANLLTNAIHALNYNGKISIKAELNNDRLKIYFSDNGVGIPISIQDKIFDAFFTTKSSGDGSGLGLDIVKRILDRNGGQIKFESTPNIGTVFILTLKGKKR